MTEILYSGIALIIRAQYHYKELKFDLFELLILISLVISAKNFINNKANTR
jgi:hypothetical protein